MRGKLKAIEFLHYLGVDFRRPVRFLKKQCRIERGFDAQQVGLGIPSATTTGLVTYVLSYLGELNKTEDAELRSSILRFQVDHKFCDAGFSSQSYICTWATSQCLLGLLSLSSTRKADVAGAVQWLCQAQSQSGGWSFSGLSRAEEDRPVYLVYCILALLRYYVRYQDQCVLSNLAKAHEFASNLEPRTNIDRIIKQWALVVLSRVGGFTTKASPSLNIDFLAIINNEFRDYVVYEHSVSPFSLQFYTPASYLLTRAFLRPNHPYNLYLTKYLLSNHISGESWCHVTAHDTTRPYTYCTALALLSLLLWARDSLNSGVCVSSYRLPSARNLRCRMVRASSRPSRIFISYTATDRQSAEKIARALRRRGFEVWYDQWDVKVGDSIITEIAKGIRKADFFLVLLSRKSLKSEWVREELDAAKIKEIVKRKVLVLPVLLESCKIPELISAKKYADFRISVRKGMRELLDALV